jgi:hypothetical protein
MKRRIRLILVLTAVWVAAVVVDLLVGGVLVVLSAAPTEAQEPIPVQVLNPGIPADIFETVWAQHWDIFGREDAIPAPTPGLIERPTATLMDPYFAKKYLRGDAWAAWAFQYNERAREVGQRTEGIRGTTTHVETIRGTTTITTTPQVNRNEYSGGPLTIYNPYCPPLE